MFSFIEIINSLQVIKLELSWKCSNVKLQILDIIFFLIPRIYEMRIIWNIAWNYLKIKYKTNYFGTTWIRIEKVTFAHFNSVRKYNWRNCKKKSCETMWVFHSLFSRMKKGDVYVRDMQKMLLGYLEHKNSISSTIIIPTVRFSK